MVNFDKEKILEQLDSLKLLPQIKEVKALRQRLERELERLTSKKELQEITSETKIGNPNVKRSSKLSRYWRYVRLVRDNFPNLEIGQIRSQLKKRRGGGDSDIPDAVWQNPSP